MLANGVMHIRLALQQGWQVYWEKEDNFKSSATLYLAENQGYANLCKL